MSPAADLGVLPATVLALVGNFLLSLGMVLQKRNVAWLDGGRGWRRFASPAFAGWLLGFVLMNLVTVFNYLALLGLSANVVSALIGSSVAFTALLTALVLKRPPDRRELLWSALLFAALALSGLRGGRPGRSIDLGALVVFLVLPLLLGGALLIRHQRQPQKRGRVLAVLLAAVSGSLGGYMVLPMRAVQIVSGPDIVAWFGTPYLYCYLAAGASSFVLLQLAYKDGELAAVSPAYYGIQVLWPALASYAVLGTAFDPLQAGGFAVVALSVWMIARGKPRKGDTSQSEVIT